MFSPRSVMVSSLTFKPLAHVEFIPASGIRKWPLSIFRVYLSRFPSTSAEESVLAPSHVLAASVIG